MTANVFRHRRFVSIDMRVLTVSDKIEPVLYSPRIVSRVGPIDLVISCGDLPFYYLDFISSMLGAPCFFVFGNHAQGLEHGLPMSAHRVAGVNLDGRVIFERGLLLAGLEGARRYNRNPRFQYSDSEMWWKVLRMAPSLWAARMRYGRYLDILVTHAPPRGIHDGPDVAHQGFAAFLAFMRWFKPRFLVHGHKHIYRQSEPCVTRYGETTVINTYGFRILDWDQPDPAPDAR